jgi:hypothetical protein
MGNFLDNYYIIANASTFNKKKLIEKDVRNQKDAFSACLPA